MESIEQPPLVFQGSEKDKLKTITIIAENVKKALGKMRIDKAPGVDDMSPRLLVQIADCIVEPLCDIYNNSILDGIVPQDWKRANVCPVHKKGSRIVADLRATIGLLV